MVSEKLGAAFIEVGADLGPLEKGLSSAQGMMQHAGTNMVGGLKSSLQSGNFADVGRQLGDDLVGGLTSQFGMLGNAAGTLATALGPVGVALLGIGAAVVGVGMVIKSAVGAAADFQQSMANVASVTGGGAEELKALSDAAREAGSSTVFSAMEAADAQYFLASAGMSTDEIIASLGDTLLLAGAGGLEMGRAAEIVTNSLSQFNMEASESGRIANVLAAAASGANTTVSQMGVGMAKVGPIANALGMSFEQTSASLMVLANAGIKGEEGGTMLRGVLSSLMDVSPKAAEALAEMGLSAEDIDPALNSIDEIFKKLNASGMTASQAVKIFGREASSAAINLAAGADDIKGYEEAITDTTKAQEMYNTQSDTFQGAMKMLGSAVSEAKISLGNVFLPILTDAVKWMADGVTAATNLGKALFGMYESAKLFAGEKIVEPGKGLIDRGIAGLARTFGFDAVAAYYAGEEIGSDLASGIEAGIDGVGDAVTGELESADGAGAGKKVGADFAREVSKEVKFAFENLGATSDADFVSIYGGMYNWGEPTPGPKFGQKVVDMGSLGIAFNFRSGAGYPIGLMVNGKDIGSYATIDAAEAALKAEYPDLYALIDPLELEKQLLEGSLENLKLSSDTGTRYRERLIEIGTIRAQLKVEPEIPLWSDLEKAEWIFDNRKIEDSFAGRSKLVMEWAEKFATDGNDATTRAMDTVLKGLIDPTPEFAPVMEAALSELFDPYVVEKIMGEYWASVGTGLTDSIVDAAKFQEYKLEELGATWGKALGDGMISVQEKETLLGIVDALELVGYEGAAALRAAIEAEDWEGLGALIGSRMKVDLSGIAGYGQFADALFWSKYGGSETKHGLGEYADDLRMISEQIGDMGREAEIAWDLVLNPPMDDPILATTARDFFKNLISGGYIEGVDDPAAVDAISDYFVRHALKGADKAKKELRTPYTESGGLPDWWSPFGVWQEQNDMFQQAYVGPTEGWAGPGMGAKPGWESKNYFQYGVEVDLTLDTTEADTKIGNLEDAIEADKIAPIDADIGPAADQLGRLEAAIAVPSFKPVWLEVMNPEAIGGGGGSFNPATGTGNWLPVLDSGAIVSGPTIAALAANNRPEVVAPLDDLTRIIAAAVGSSGRGGGNTYNITVNESTDARATAKLIAEEIAKSEEGIAVSFHNGYARTVRP